VQTKIAELGAHQRLLTLTLDAAELEAAREQATRKLGKDLNLKGFRPGKAPRRMVESAVGIERIQAEAIELALSEHLVEALTVAGLEPATSPELRETRDVDGGLEADLAITLWPRPSRIPTLAGRRIEVSSPQVSNDEIKSQIDRLRAQYSDLEDVARPSQEGDFVQIDLSAKAGGLPVEDVAARDLLYEVGSRAFVAGLDEQATGKRPGEIVKFPATLPPGFGKHAGQEVELTVLVKAVRQRKLPELTDAWVDEVSELSTIAELEAKIREGLAPVKRAMVADEYRAKLLAETAQATDLELPEPLIVAETQSRLHNLLHELNERGLAVPDYLSATGLSEDTLVAQVRAQAVRALRSRILLDAVAEQEGIGVDDEELEAALTSLAEAAKQAPEELSQKLRTDGRAGALAGDILRRKALDRMAELARPVDAEGNELELEPEESSEEVGAT